jgi:hypothetical protein
VRHFPFRKHLLWLASQAGRDGDGDVIGIVEEARGDLPGCRSGRDVAGGCLWSVRG